MDLGSGDGRIVSLNRIFGGEKTVLAAVQVLHCSYFNPKGAGSQSAGLLSSCWLRAQPLAYPLVLFSCMESRPS